MCETTPGQGSETDNWRTRLRQSVQTELSRLQEQEPHEVQQKQASSPALGKKPNSVHQYKLETLSTTKTVPENPCDPD